MKAERDICVRAMIIEKQYAYNGASYPDKIVLCFSLVEK